MAWINVVLLLVGAWSTIAGVVLLGRTVRAILADGGSGSADAASVTAASDVLLGVALVFAGSVILYIGLVLGGFLAPL